MSYVNLTATNTSKPSNVKESNNLKKSASLPIGLLGKSFQHQTTPRVLPSDLSVEEINDRAQKSLEARKEKDRLTHLQMFGGGVSKQFQ